MDIVDCMCSVASAGACFAEPEPRQEPEWMDSTGIPFLQHFSGHSLPPAHDTQKAGAAQVKSVGVRPTAACPLIGEVRGVGLR